MPKSRRAKQRQAAPAAPDIRYYTDERGNACVEHSGGKFRLNRRTGRYEALDA